MRLAPIILIFALAGCASDGRKLVPGVHDAATVRDQMGTPTEILALPEGGEAWFYPYGRTGRRTYRVELDPQGRVRGVEQVLYEQNFDRIVDGKTTQEELRRMLGPPNEIWQGLNRSEWIWDYRYLWASQPFVLRVGVDERGVVTGQFRATEQSDDGRPGI